MKKISLETRVGVLIVLALGLVVFFAFLKGYFDYRRGYEVQVLFSQVAGVERGAPVRLSGVRVGEVRKVEIAYDMMSQVMLTIHLDESVRLGRRSRFLIRSFGLIGEKYVEIVPSPVDDLPLIEPGEMLSGTEPVSPESLMLIGEELAGVAKSLMLTLDDFVGDPALKETILEAGEEFTLFARQGRATLEDISAFSREGERLAASLGGIGRDVSRVADEVGEAVASGREFFDSGRELAVSAGQLVRENRPLVNQSLVNFQVASAALALSGERFAEIMERAAGPDSSLGRLISTPRLYDQLAGVIGRVDDSLGTLDETLAEAGLVLSDVRSGRGTLGRIIGEDDLYRDIRSLLEDLSAFLELWSGGLSIELRHHPWMRPRRGEGR